MALGLRDRGAARLAAMWLLLAPLAHATPLVDVDADWVASGAADRGLRRLDLGRRTGPRDLGSALIRAR